MDDDFLIFKRGRVHSWHPLPGAREVSCKKSKNKNYSLAIDPNANVAFCHHSVFHLMGHGVCFMLFCADGLEGFQFRIVSIFCDVLSQ